MNKSQIINITISIIIILSIGITAGYSAGYFHATRNRFSEIKFVDEINQGVATIKLIEIKNGKLSGITSGQNVRIAYSPDKIIDLNPGGSFEIPLNGINLKNFYQVGNIPKNAMYIASKNGKYYYSVLDKRALNISVKNRIYFSDSKEAEKMGYAKK